MEWSQNIFPDHLKPDIKSLRSFCNISYTSFSILYLFQRRPRKEWIWLAHHGRCLLRRNRSTLTSPFVSYSCLTHTWIRICQPLNKEKVKTDPSYPVAITTTTTTIYFSSSQFTFVIKLPILCLPLVYTFSVDKY